MRPVEPVVARRRITNVTIAKDQPQYQPLPAHRDADGVVYAMWRLSLWERIKVLFNGHVWSSTMTFNHPLQPLMLSVDCPLKKKKEEPGAEQ